MRLDATTWAEVRRAFVETTEPLTRIAGRFGVAHSTIQGRARRENWPPRPPDGVRVVPSSPDALLPASDLSVTAERLERREPDTAETRIRRMLGIIDLQLDQMERRMTSGQPLTTQDQERQARALGAIAGNLEKVTEAAADIFRDRGHDGAAHGNTDAEDMRRQIAERLERLNAQWLAQESSK